MKTYCPYCRKEVVYFTEKRDVKEFRGVKIDTFENVAVCKNCHNDLYVNEIEDENNLRTYDAYRKKTNTIAPQDIIDFRNKYKFSQRELTAILGLGKMTINRYERGAVPTKSQSDYLKMLTATPDALVSKAKEAYNAGRISEKTLNKVTSDNNDDFSDTTREYICAFLDKKPSIYNGYKNFDLNLLENIISFISSKVNNLTITSLNKYLWYIDMFSFAKRGIGITGLTYQKQQFGPTIFEKKYEEISKLNGKYERNDFENESDGSLRTTIKSKKNYKLDGLNEEEIDIINSVIKLLKNKSVSEISKLSHQEDGWRKTKKLDCISYEYALNLKAIK